ncbi:MAG: serine/threonine-protein kinase [Myxococcota bacterium]
MSDDEERGWRETLQGCPDANELDARLALAQLREQLFGRPSAVQIGRFRLLRLLGRGAHGRVFEAEDGELRRTVALKLLSPEHGEASRPPTQLREARSLARLSHPHVVEVFDTGVHEQQLWIAMELVRGVTLAQWAEQHPPGGRERFDRVCTILDEAAAGLAAAHERGLIHRDFKPANVLVGNDGRVRVADFGLARAGANPGDSLVSGWSHPSMSMTRIAGTPRYMSPEQLRGDPVDAASDQFGFAVTAWELVFGEHPFAGVSPLDLAEDPDLRPQEQPESSLVPAPFTRALRRALSPTPAARFASMQELRRALKRRPTPRRWWVLAGAVVTAGALGLGWTTAPSVTPVTCHEDTARARFATVWSPARRSTLQASLQATDADGAAALVGRIERQVERYADAWVEQDLATCRARWVDESIDDARFDARAACLRDGLSTLSALLARLETPDTPAVARAIAAVRSLPSPARCDSDAVPADSASPLHRSLSKRLAIVRADLAAGHYAQTAAAAETLAAEAAAAELGTLAADAYAAAGIAWGELGDPRRFAAFESAYYLSAELTDGRELARHANALAMQHAYAEAPDEAEEWLRHADAGLRRHPDDAQVLTRQHVRGLLQQRRHEWAAATETFEGILAQIDESRSELDELAWLAGAALLQTHMGASEFDVALEKARRLDERTIRTLGASHPRRARISMVLARIAREQGHPERTIEHLETAVQQSERGYGRLSPRTATAYLNLGYNQHLFGNLEGAEHNYWRGLAAMGDVHDQFRVRLLRGLARVCLDREQLTCAETHLQAAVSSGRRVWPDGDRERASAERELAELLLARERPDEAVRHLRATLDNLGPSPSAGRLARAVGIMVEAEAAGAQIPDLPELRRRALTACADDDSPGCRRLASKNAEPASVGLHADAGEQ